MNKYNKVVIDAFHLTVQGWVVILSRDFSVCRKSKIFM